MTTYDANGNEIPETPAAPAAYVPQNAEWADGPVGVAKKMYDNATRGQGVVGLATTDGTVAGGLGLRGTPDVRDGAPGPTSGAEYEDGVYPGTPGQMGANNDALEGLRARLALRAGLSEDNGPGPPKAFYAGAHTEFSQLGGKRGEELFNRAYGDGPEDGPTKLAAAVAASDKAQGQRAEALSQAYDQEADRATQAAAARRMSTQADAAELKQRQENLQLASQQYTNDLADTGKFWTNPGNIIAAISFSLMPIFSNDPTVGVKLVNQAIQQDLDNRRANAQGALGALRSNLDGYYKLAGDRQAGDVLAEAEARRIAALDVERIMAKFESPISKARGEAVSQNLRMQAAQGYMQAFSQARVFQPAAKMDPELYKLRTKGYRGAWQGMDDVAPIQPVAASAMGSVGGSPSLAPNQPFTSHVSPNVQMVIKSGAPDSVIAQLAMEGRIPGSANMYTALSGMVNRSAAAKAKGKGPDEVRAARDKILDDADKEIAAAPGHLLSGTRSIASRTATLSELEASAAIIAASESANGRDPNKFLGSMRAIVGDKIANNYEELVRTFQDTKGLSPAAARELARNTAIQDFRQKLSMQISSAYNDISGGAISSTELPRLEASIRGSSDFGYVRNWLRAKSTEVENERNTAISGLSPIALMSYLTQAGVGQRHHPLNVRPTAGPAKAPEGRGEVSADPSLVSSGARPYSGTIGGKPGSDH